MGTYLHLGRDVVVIGESVIGVFDLDNSSQSHITREYLYAAEREGKVVNIGEDLPRSFVVCAEPATLDGDEGTDSVYLTQIASQTLLKRSRVF